ncbi:MAG: hypothetical protein U5K56_17155 [Halioglobus sp.]|nr:hypothetical protein [Halioglobus sp.]
MVRARRLSSVGIRIRSGTALPCAATGTARGLHEREIRHRLGAARTGSTLLVRTLNSLEGVRCHGGLLGKRVRGYEDDFDPAAASPAEREARMAALQHERDADPAGFIRRALAGDCRASGFKAMYAAFLDPRWGR